MGNARQGVPGAEGGAAAPPWVAAPGHSVATAPVIAGGAAILATGATPSPWTRNSSRSHPSHSSARATDAARQPATDDGSGKPRPAAPRPLVPLAGASHLDDADEDCIAADDEDEDAEDGLVPRE